MSAHYMYFGGSNPCRGFHSWQVILDNGKSVYRECAKCKARRVDQFEGGHQPIDEQWIKTGEWYDPVKQFVPFNIGNQP